MLSQHLSEDSIVNGFRRWFEEKHEIFFHCMRKPRLGNIQPRFRCLLQFS